MANSPFGNKGSAATTKDSAPANTGIAVPNGDGEVTSTKPAGDPFGLPTGPGGDVKVADLVGELLLVKPTELLADFQTSNGQVDTIRADVVPLTGEIAGELQTDMLIFQRALVRDLKRTLDGPDAFLLGKLGMGAKKEGKNAPYIFETPDQDDIDKARAYLSQ